MASQWDTLDVTNSWRPAPYCTLPTLFVVTGWTHLSPTFWSTHYQSRAHPIADLSLLTETTLSWPSTAPCSTRHEHFYLGSEMSGFKDIWQRWCIGVDQLKIVIQHFCFFVFHEPIGSAISWMTLLSFALFIAIRQLEVPTPELGLYSIRIEYCYRNALMTFNFTSKKPECWLFNCVQTIFC